MQTSRYLRNKNKLQEEWREGWEAQHIQFNDKCFKIPPTTEISTIFSQTNTTRLQGATQGEKIKKVKLCTNYKMAMLSNGPWKNK